MNGLVSKGNRGSRIIKGSIKILQNKTVSIILFILIAYKNRTRYEDAVETNKRAVTSDTLVNNILLIPLNDEDKFKVVRDKD